MAQYIPDTRYICSIFPGTVEPQRRNYGPSRESYGKGAVRSTLFSLPQVKRDAKHQIVFNPYERGSKREVSKRLGSPAFVTMLLMDSFEEVLDVVGQSATAERGTKPRLQKPVPVESIVSDLLNCWTGGLHNVPQGAKPGIGEIVNQSPSQEELKGLNDQQTLYFEYLFQEGERLHKQNNWKEITETMRIGAEWLGHSREWSNRAIASDSSPCPLCTEIVPNAASFCPKCNQQIGFLENGVIIRGSAEEILMRLQPHVPPQPTQPAA